MLGHIIGSVEHASPHQERNRGAEMMEEMVLHRFLNTIRNIHPVSPFDSYVMNLQRSGRPGAPKMDEARKDFRSFINNGGHLV